MKKVYFWLIAIFFIGFQNIKAQNFIYGVTGKGGSNNVGSIFSFDITNPVYNPVYNLTTPFSGGNPYGNDLTQAGNGKLYGMTTFGGALNKGVLFEYDPILNTYSKKMDFLSINGANPYGSLLYSSSNGLLYGLTSLGGYNDKGVLFSFNPSNNQYIVLDNFNGTNNGANPCGSLIKASDGNLYGMTLSGGTYGVGTIFKVIIKNSIIVKLYDFNNSGTPYGIAFPYGSLMQATNGKLYGMSSGGGINNNGTIFEYTIGSGITDRLTLDDSNTGRMPTGSLIEDPINHKLYGMSYQGGANNYGTIIEYNFNSIPHTITKKIDFDGYNGMNPWGSLIRLYNGKFYGLTSNTYPNMCASRGTLFEYDNTTNVLTTKHFFSTIDGISPFGSLVLSSNGKLYGMTLQGGALNGDMWNSHQGGTIFEYEINTESCNAKIRFEYSSNGIHPTCLAKYNNSSTFYGIAKSGGNNDAGVLFMFNSNTNTYSKFLDFDYNESPYELPYYPKSIIIDNNENGIIYGITDGGIFNYHLDGDENSYCFISTYPCGLTMGCDGMIYIPTMYRNQDNNYGSIVKYNPLTNSSTEIFNNFNGTNGNYPIGSLLQVSNNIYYGMTTLGGNSDNGVIFEYNTQRNIYNVKHIFTGDDGGRPIGSLIKASNGMLYGMTTYGGKDYRGVFFQYNLNGTYTPLINFGDYYSTIGGNPEGTLMQASNGMLYGSTASGGQYGYGTIFSYNIQTNNIVAIQHLTGANLVCDHFIEINIDNREDQLKEFKTITEIIESSTNNIVVYPNPASNYIMINNTENANIQLFDMLGNKVMDINNVSNLYKIDVSNLLQGTYIVKIIQNNKVITKRVSLIK